MKTGFNEMLRRLEAEERKKLDAKIPAWSGLGIEIPSSLNFQQCSGQTAALYKASLIAEGSRVADLTGGLGADSWAFSRRASALWYNERDAALANAVRRNFGLLGVSNAEFHNFDIVPSGHDWTASLGAFRPDVIYIDPSRRDRSGRKVFLLEDCSPDVQALMPLLHSFAPLVMIKVSPMADMTMLRRRLADSLAEIHVVGAGGECKELLCICRRGAGPVRTVLSEDGKLYPWADGGGPDAERGELLFVPSAALVKSALPLPPGAEALGTGSRMCRCGWNGTLSSFGSFYRILEDAPFSKGGIREVGARYPRAEVSVRGIPVSAEELRAKLKTGSGGPVHIFACLCGGERRLLVTEKVTAPEQPV